jgi:hypothetical protein
MRSAVKLMMATGGERAGIAFGAEGAKPANGPSHASSWASRGDVMEPALLVGCAPTGDPTPIATQG